MKNTEEIINFLNKISSQVNQRPLDSINQRAVYTRKKMIISMISAYIKSQEKDEQFYLEKIKDLF